MGAGEGGQGKGGDPVIGRHARPCTGLDDCPSVRAARRATPPPMADLRSSTPLACVPCATTTARSRPSSSTSTRRRPRRTVAELRAALAADDREEVRRLAHRLKGSARNVGATGMAELAGALEAGPPDPRRRSTGSRAPLDADLRRAAGRARRLTPGGQTRAGIGFSKICPIQPR